VTLQRLDTRPIPSVFGEIRAFLPVRNEALRLPDNLNHHRGLGVSLLGICFWREGLEATFGPERRGEKGG
jgi:hypothetical protein